MLLRDILCHIYPLVHGSHGPHLPGWSVTAVGHGRGVFLNTTGVNNMNHNREMNLNLLKSVLNPKLKSYV